MHRGKPDSHAGETTLQKPQPPRRPLTIPLAAAIGLTAFLNVSSAALTFGVAPGAQLLSGTPAEFQNYAAWAPTGSPSVAGAACPIPSASGSCLSFTASASDGTYLISAVFPTVQGQFYTVHIQAMSGDASTWTGQLIPARNGPVTWETIEVFNDPPPSFQISPSVWSSYDFTFEASETLENARLNLLLPAGSHLILGTMTAAAATSATVAQGAPLLSGTLTELQSYSAWAPSGSPSVTPGVACPTPSSSGNCLSFTASASATTDLISSIFPTVQGQFYSVHLQAMSGDASTWTGTWNAGRNGPTYEYIDYNGPPPSFQITPAGWSSFDFVFQSSETLANGRLDVHLPAGSHLILGALTVTPISPRPSGLTLPSGWTNAPIPLNYFGMSRNNIDYPWPAATFGTSRSWDLSHSYSQFGVSWQDIETARGTYNWGTLDSWISEAQSHGADMLYTFGRTPAWASSNPALRCTYDPPAPGPTSGCDYPPQNEQDWKDFVAAIVTHSAGRIKFWELWNEPLATATWSGTTAQMVTMANDAYATIKSIDASAIVLTPCPGSTWDGFSTVSGAAWLDQYLAAGGTPADVLSIHGYYSTTAEDIPNVFVPGYQRVLAAHGLSSEPIWETEDGGQVRSFANESDRAAYIAKYYLLDWSFGIARFIWYTWDGYDGCGGACWGTLWTPSGGVNTVGVAYQQVQSWMQGATMTVPCARDWQNTWTCTLTRPGGYQALAVWNQLGSISYTADARYTQYRDLAGNTTVIAGPLALSKSPILLETGSFVPATPSPSGAALGVSSITWTWSAISGASSYKVFEASSPATFISSANWTVLTGLSTNTAYGILVQTVGSVAGSLSAASTAYTLAAPPTSLAFQNVFASSVTVSWSSNTNPAGTSYGAQIWQPGGSTTTLIVTTTSATFVNLAGGATYFLSVEALNGDGIAAPSNLSVSTSPTGAPGGAATLTANPPAGTVTLTIPAGALPSGTPMAIQIMAAPPGANGGMTAIANSAIDITAGGQPGSPVTLVFSYANANLAGVDPSTLVIAWYNPASGVWVELPSTVDTLDHTITATVRHFSIFQVMASKPASDLASVRVIPNPFRPALGQTAMGFFNLPAFGRVRIYNHAGALLKDLTATGAGLATWDGTNEQGFHVATGVYYAVVQGMGHTKTITVAIQR